MKYLFILLILSGILLQTFSKVIILAKFELNREYIAKNLCENKSKPSMHCEGKCVLKKQLKEDNEKEHELSNAPTEKFEAQVFTESFSRLKFITQTSSRQTHITYSLHLPNAALAAIFHPPKV